MPHRHGTLIVKHFAQSAGVTRELAAWTAMIGRCHSPTNQAYKHYGARGITVCDAWRKSFFAFLHDMGRRPSSRHTLERRENDGNYTPENCCWATFKEQENNRRDNLRLTHNGVTRTLSQWAEHTGIHRATIGMRLRAGVPLTVALTHRVLPRGAHIKLPRKAEGG